VGEFPSQSSDTSVSTLVRDWSTLGPRWQCSSGSEFLAGWFFASGGNILWVPVACDVWDFLVGLGYLFQPKEMDPHHCASCSWRPHHCIWFVAQLIELSHRMLASLLTDLLNSMWLSTTEPDANLVPRPRDQIG